MGLMKSISRGSRAGTSGSGNTQWVILDGDRALQRKLDQFTATVQRRVMRPAISRGLTPILKTAKALAPKETGLLKKSLGRRVRTSRRTGEVYGMVGVRRERGALVDVGGKTEFRDPAEYAHLVEYGHGGPKPAAAQPFLRPALDARRGDALRIVGTVAREKLAREASR